MCIRDSSRVIGPATMQLLSQFFCRLFRQPSSFLRLAAFLALLAGVMVASLSTGAEEAPAAGAKDSEAAPEREDGFTVQVPQSPALVPIKIGYLREMAEHPRPASRLDIEPKDAGIAGAKMAIEENNAGGRFTGHDYSLDVSTVASAEKAVEALKKFYESGHHYIVVDASADTLLKLSDWAKDKDTVSYTHLRAHETDSYLVCRLLL